MEPFNWFMKVVTEHYYDFDGRARRAEFWWYALVNFAISTAIALLGSLFGVGALPAGLFVLALLLPSIGVGVRRMHDIDRSGWFMLVPVMDLVWAARPGDSSANRYGPDPKVAAV